MQTRSKSPPKKDTSQEAPKVQAKPESPKENQGKLNTASNKRILGMKLEAKKGTPDQKKKKRGPNRPQNVSVNQRYFSVNPLRIVTLLVVGRYVWCPNR